MVEVENTAMQNTRKDVQSMESGSSIIDSMMQFHKSKQSRNGVNQGRILIYVNDNGKQIFGVGE